MNVRPFLPSDRPEQENFSAVATLLWRARHQLITRKSGYEAANDYLNANRVPEQMQRIIKAPVAGVGTGDASLGSGGVSIGNFSNSARTAGGFYQMLDAGAFIRVRANTRAALLTSSPTAAVLPEGKAASVSRAVLNNVLVGWQKVSSLLVCSSELLLRVDAAGQQMLARELLNVVAGGVDAAFVAKVGTGLTPISSTAPMADVRAALAAVTGSLSPQLFWLSAVDVAKWGATLTPAKGGPAFEGVFPGGGKLCGYPLIPSSTIPSGFLYLFDASQIAVDATAPTLDMTSEGDIQMDSAPTSASDVPTPTSMTSMFTTDSVAMQSIAWLAAEKLRSTATALVSGITSTTWTP